jgi:predicted dehydrogenase
VHVAAAIIDPCNQCPEDAVIAAIAARDRSRCEEYVQEKDLAHATVYDGYQELLDQAGDSIDAIYVPSPNGLHYHWTMQALGAGYHVLCEKPFAVRAAVHARNNILLACQSSLVH